MGQLVQYANYKNANSIIEHSGFTFFRVLFGITNFSQTVETMSAGVLYLSEVVETTHEEIPDYGPEKFFADIGGAAGLANRVQSPDVFLYKVLTFNTL